METTLEKKIARLNPVRWIKPASVQTESPLGKEADLILAYWRTQDWLPLPPLPIPEGALLSSLCVGLGDTMMLTDFPRAGVKQSRPSKVFSTSAHFRPLMKFNPHWREPEVRDQSLMVNAASLVRHFQCGNGHYIQRIRRAFGFDIDIVPRGCVVWNGQRKANRVILHWDAGPHALWQRKTINPQARTLYPQTRVALEKFIASEPNMDFVCVGKDQGKAPIKGARYIETRTVADLVNLVAGSGYFLGIISGVYHLATALQLKVIGVVDFPEGWKIMLPTIKQNGQLESEWLYPQNVHLHQSEPGPLCPSASTDNLKRAMNGEIFPFWKTDYCQLINEQV